MNSPVKIQTRSESTLRSIKQLSERFGKAKIALIDADEIAFENNVTANLSDTCRLLSDAVAESTNLDNLLSEFPSELLDAGQVENADSFVKERDNLSKAHSLMLVSMLSLLNHGSHPDFLPLIHVRRVLDVVMDLLSDLRVSLEELIPDIEQSQLGVSVVVIGGRDNV